MNSKAHNRLALDSEIFSKRLQKIELSSCAVISNRAAMSGGYSYYCRFDEFLLCTKGHVFIETASRKQQISSNEGAFLRCETIIKIKTTENCEYIQIRIHGSFLELFLSDGHSFPFPRSIFLVPFLSNWDTAHAIVALINSRDSWTISTLNSGRLFLELIKSYLSGDCFRDLISQFQKAITSSHIIAFTRCYFNFPVNRTVLAEFFQLNTSYISTTFKEMFSMTPIQYLNQQRVDFSKILLDQGFNNEQVILSCDYGDLSGFIQNFKKLNGFTPAKWLKLKESSPELYWNPLRLPEATNISLVEYRSEVSEHSQRIQVHFINHTAKDLLIYFADTLGISSYFSPFVGHTRRRVSATLLQRFMITDLKGNVHKILKCDKGDCVIFPDELV